MKIPALNTLKLGSFLTRLQFLCLFLAGILEFASVALVHSITYQLLYWILPVLVCVFCITVIIQICKTQTPPPLIPIVVMVAWFFIIQLFPDVKQITLRNYGLFLSVYLLAFPFAMITQDEDRQLGLKMIATFYVAIALTLICYAVLLFADCVPGFLKDNFFWDNARLYVMVHPNVFARVLLISIACCLGACIHTSDKRLKVLLLDK